MSDLVSTEKKESIEESTILDEFDEKLKILPASYVPDYFLDILKYLLEKEEKNSWFQK